MALTDKDILITPNIGSTNEPKIEFKGASASVGPSTITATIYPTNNGTLSFDGTAGQLFSITNNLTSGSIFSVNDVSGIPSINVDANGTINFGAYGGNIGLGVTNPTQKLHVQGNARITGALYDSNNLAGTSGQVLKSTGVGITWTSQGSGGGLDADTLDGLNSGYNGVNVILRTDANAELLLDDWIRIGSGTGLYNSNGAHFYEDTSYGWFARSRVSSSSIRLQSYQGTVRGWLYANDANEQGFLDTSGNWRLQVPNSGNILRNGIFTIWDSGNDGSGSGLDADLLDGKNTGTSGNTIPLLDGNNTWSGSNLFTATLSVSTTNSFTISASATGESYNPAGAVSNKNAYSNAGTIASLVSSTNSVDSGCLIDFNAYNSSGGATGVFIGAAAGPTGNGPANFVVGRRTGTQTWSESLRVNTNGNLGINTANPTSRLHVVGDALITGVTTSVVTYMNELVIDAGTRNSTNDATVYITATNNNDWGLVVNKFNSSATEYGADIRVGDGATYALRILGSGSEKFRVEGSGNIHTVNGVYASNWFRSYGETGFYSQSYGQHFYPDSGGFYWESDGPIRHRDGYEGSVIGYSFYHDASGKGHLAASGEWWLNQGVGENGTQLVIGGNTSLNAYNSVTGRRLMFGSGSADARDNYYIGTNLENYGGNYNKLDLRWHTGIRMGAQPSYGGIRFYDTEALGTQVFAIGKDGSYAQANQSMRAPIFYDLDDTGYKLDATSTANDALRIRGGTLHGPNVTWGKYLHVGGDGRQGYIDNADVASVSTTNGNLHIDAASGYYTYINHYDGSGVFFGNGASAIVAEIASNGTFRSPVYYDYNNTSYYLDPASATSMAVAGIVNTNAGRLVLRDNSLENHATDNDTSEIAVNYYGYASGTTRFRDFAIYNGKNVSILRAVGSTGNVLINNTTATGTASQPFQVTGGAYVSGNLGIGTTNPGDKLHVEGGNIRIQNTNPFLTFSDTTIASSSYRIGVSEIVEGDFFIAKYSGSAYQIDTFYIDSSRNVLIRATSATGTASQPLQVTGGAYVSGNTGIGLTNPLSRLSVNAALDEASIGGYAANNTFIFGLGRETNSLSLDAYSEILFRTGSTSGSRTGTIKGRFDSSGNLLINASSATGTASQPLQVTGGAYVSGSVGIGITNPTNAALHISGGASYGGALRLTNTGTSGGDYFILSSDSTWTAGADKLLIGRGNPSSTNVKIVLDSSGNVLINNTTATGTASQPLQVTGGAYVSGNLGVGAVSPSYKLDVNGSIRASVTGGGTGLLLHVNTGWSATANLAQFWTGQGSGFAFYANSNGDGSNVLLHVAQDGNVTATTSLRAPIFYDSDNASYYADFANSTTSIVANGNVLIGTTTSTGTASQKLQITGGAYVSGNLGVGITNPTAKLHVVGDVVLTTPTTSVVNITSSSYMWNQQINGGNNWYIGPTNSDFGIGINKYVFSSSGSSPSSELVLERGNTKLLEVLQSDLFYKTNRVWHAGNDGSGSGLDADTLDGKNTGTSGNTIPLLDGNNTWSGTQTFSAQIQSTKANDVATGGGQIYLNGATGNRIDFNTNGVAAPATTTRSVGTKLVLYPNISASSVDYAFGIESSTLWSSVPDTGTQFKWYAGTTNIATLTGGAALTVGSSVYISGITGGSTGNRLVVGNTSVNYSLQDASLRPIIQAHGQYPVVSLNHTVTGNTSHGPTLQFTCNGTGNQFVIGTNGSGTFLSMGYSSAADWNPHNGIAGYNGTSFFHANSSGYIGLGAQGDWSESGGSGSNVPGYNLHFIGSINGSNGHAALFDNRANAVNGSGFLFRNLYSNHSWGIIAEYRMETTGGGSDRPSILFSTGYNSNTWSVGYGYTDDNFRIKYDHGHRNGGWGTTAVEIDRSSIMTVYGEIRAPIFYDSNNVARYLDPASTSELETVKTRGLIVNASSNTSTPTAGYLSFWDANGTTSRAQFVRTDQLYGTHGAVTDTYAQYWLMDSPNRGWIFRYATSDTAGTNVFSIRNNDGLTTIGAGGFTAGSVYAQVNIHAGSGSANTTYRDIDLKGNWAGGEGHAITAIHSTGSSNIVGQMVFQHDGPGSRIKWGRLYHSGDRSTYPMNLISLDASGNASLQMSAGSDIRAPIFYDIDNANYYLDPASTSILNVLNLTGRLGIDNPADYSSTAITSLTSAPIDSYVQYEPNAGTSVVYFPMIHQTALYNSGYRTHTSYGLVKRSNAWDAAHYFAIGGSDSAPTESFFLNYGGSIGHTNGYLIIDGSARSPIFYDSDNPSYYADFANSTTSIVANGNVLIGSTTATGTSSQKLQVTGGAYVSGNVGIGTTNPTEKLDVIGTVKATDFNTTSDETLKTNISTIENSLEKVSQIRGVNFEWKDGGRKSAGVIAQEIEKVLPELVRDNGTKTVNYNGLIGVLIEAVKELSAEVETLKTMINK